MSQKRRGLGRGLGALIPSAPEGDRPVDVFFPGSDKESGGDSRAGVLTAVDEGGGSADAPEAQGADAGGESGSKNSVRSKSWDSAIADGRLKIRTAAETGAVGIRLGEVSTDPVAALAGLAGRLESEASLEASPAETGTSYDGTGLRLVRTVDVEGDVDSASSTDVVSRETTELLPVPGARFAEIPVDAIKPNSWQPRTVFDEAELDELVASIKEIGLLQPVVVRPAKEEDGTYELIMGERRWRAAGAAALEKVPAIVRETDDADMLRDALLENLHRVALNPLEEAAAYRQLLDDFGCTHEELATRIARSRPQISNTLRLLKLPPLVQRRVAAGVLSAGHARALLGLADGAEIERLAQRIVSEGLSVRATEEIVTLLTTGGEQKARRAPRAGQRSEAVDELATRLSDRFDTRVKVSVGKTKGRLTLEFASVEDLNRILAVMAPDDPGLLRS